MILRKQRSVSPTDHTIVKAKNISSLLLLTKQKEKMRTCCLPSCTSSSSSSPLVSSSPASRRVRLRKVHLFAANENEERERELDEKTREALRLPSKSSQDDEEAPSQKGNKRFGNVEGGKYGLGNRVDKALDATTDELQFKIGAIVCVTLPVLLLIFGPRPPSEY